MGFYLADSFIATDTHSSVGCENIAIETFLLLLPFSSSFIFLLLKNPERLSNTHWDRTRLNLDKYGIFLTTFLLILARKFKLVFGQIFIKIEFLDRNRTFAAVCNLKEVIFTPAFRSMHYCDSDKFLSRFPSRFLSKSLFQV